MLGVTLHLIQEEEKYYGNRDKLQDKLQLDGSVDSYADFNE